MAKKVIVEEVKMAARQPFNLGQGIVNSLGIKRLTPFEEGIFVAEVTGVRTTPRNHD